MTTYNTGNPLGSAAVKDLYDNAENLDRAVNDRTNDEWKDRFGQKRQTFSKMERRFDGFMDASETAFQQFLVSSGYQDLGDYAASLTITARNQIFRKDGDLYRLAASQELPYTTTGVWEDEAGNFVVVGDDSLRQQLADIAGNGDGASMVGFYQEGTGAVRRSVESKLRESVSVKDFGAVGDGVTDDTDAIQKATDYCSQYKLDLYIPAGDYVISDTIIIANCGVDGFGARLLVDASVSIGVQVGTLTTIYQQHLRGLSVIGKGRSNHPQDSCAWLFVNVANSLLDSLSGSYMQHGCNVEPEDGCRVAYSTWLNPFFHRCNINFRVFLKENTSGFAAENSVITGRLQMSSSDPCEYHVYAYRNSSAGSMNHWRWDGTAMESSQSAFGQKSAMRLLGANYWRIHEIRPEGSWLEGDVYLSSSCTGNVIETQYTDGTFIVDDNGTKNFVKRHQNNTTQGPIAALAPVSTSCLELWQRDATAKNSIVSDGTAIASWTAGTPGNPELVEFGCIPTTPAALIRVGGNNMLHVTGTQLRPSADNVTSCGSASYRWSTVYAGSGTINTSDARDKQQVCELSEQERAVAIRLKSLIRSFSFTTAVKRKGNLARIHFGVVAQDVCDAFVMEGLDPERYALFCYDAWKEIPEEMDSDGNIVQEYCPAGDRYGIRYDELLAFIISAL